jgi:hypothetical protein
MSTEKKNEKWKIYSRVEKYDVQSFTHHEKSKTLTQRTQRKTEIIFLP